MFKKKNVLVIFRYLALIFFSILVLIPFFYLFMTSFKTLEDVSSGTVSFWPSQNNLIENVKTVFSNEKFYVIRSFLNTMFIYVMKAVGCILTCSVAGYAFARFNCRLSRIIFPLFMAVLFLPGELLSIPFYEAMVNLGLKNNPYYIPIWVGAWFGTDVSMIFLFRQYFVSIPKSLVDAAKIDGCNEFSAFGRIVFPLSKSIIMTVLVLYFVGTYNDIYAPSLYIASNEYTKKVVAQSIGIFENLYNFGSKDYIVPWNLVSVATLVTLVPVLFFFAFAQKYFVASLVGSGIKE